MEPRSGPPHGHNNRRAEPGEELAGRLERCSITSSLSSPSSPTSPSSPPGGSGASDDGGGGEERSGRVALSAFGEVCTRRTGSQQMIPKSLATATAAVATAAKKGRSASSASAFSKKGVPALKPLVPRGHRATVAVQFPVNPGGSATGWTGQAGCVGQAGQAGQAGHAGSGNGRVAGGVRDRREEVVVVERDRDDDHGEHDEPEEEWEGKRDAGGDHDDDDGFGPGLSRGLRAQSYRRAVDFSDVIEGRGCRGGGRPGGKGPLEALSEEEPPAAATAATVATTKTRGKVKGFQIMDRPLRRRNTFDKNPGLYQNFTEKGLLVSDALREDVEAEEAEEATERSFQSVGLPRAGEEEDVEVAVAEPESPDPRIIIKHRPFRTTWSQLPEVRGSLILHELTADERKRQEVIFEIITSEHSYLHSLEVMIGLFKESSELGSTMSKLEHHHLFSNVTDIRDVSKRFFDELEARHQDNVVIEDISDIVETYASQYFQPYVTYCTNETYQQRTLQKLWSSNPLFKETLRRIEMKPECGGLPMISFLILPMQRITRLPLLMDTICQKSKPNTFQYETAKLALKSVSKVVRDCNNGAKRMEHTEMMYTLQTQLEFKIKPFPLVSASRWLLKRGELATFEEESRIFRKSHNKQLVHLFLFTDVLIITKKKSNESYLVTDYALRKKVDVMAISGEELATQGQGGAGVAGSRPSAGEGGGGGGRQGSANHLFTVTMRENHAGEHVQLVFVAELLSDRARWITGIRESRQEEPDLVRKTKELESRAQVEAVKTYGAKHPDELSLQSTDVAIVFQKVLDNGESGWYEGERLRDGERGWFPTECVREITNGDTIKSNLRRLERLMGIETVV
ncbi:rho guanine nucleotide exchange factor 16-like [Petromyzon marinus]|uniref:Rho guanine nucleotide exchange factor 26-like n=1 Tax=Petromyzon marinus TaxID=7757 RepID=A0AAJ7X781_PETMA|nr:rho guanine nucleotide exchange factor 26-like [Petromyzon marinus]XP_032824090.1 rho guanine nucleotide exchange factor 26-like [Petromyzon marinus]